MRKDAGFTLIEILLALMIFAVVATMTSIGLRNITTGRDKLQQRAKVVAKLQLATVIMQQDILQMVNRGSNSSQQQAFPAIVASAEKLSFTSANNANIYGTQQHSDLMRVSYSIDNNNLIRTINLFVDAATDSKPIVQILLKNVSALQWHFINKDGKPLTYWQVESIQGVDPYALPRAVIVDFDVKKLGHVRRVYPVGGLYVATR